jgi:hypothetical protein
MPEAPLMRTRGTPTMYHFELRRADSPYLSCRANLDIVAPGRTLLGCAERTAEGGCPHILGRPI